MTTLTKENAHELVQKKYGEIAANYNDTAASCCSAEDDGCGCQSQLYQIDISELPASVTDLSLGCGDPITLASLQTGQTVLDLGSGAGIDCFLAAKNVGESGKVIGVDMTPAMLEKARANQAKLGVTNVEFRQGNIEALPVANDEVDVVISNCVINLAPDKAPVFRETYRVLKSGGRMAVSDMVTLGQFTPAEKANAEAWAGCITGAEDVADYVRQMREAGFVDISVRDKNKMDVELADSPPQPNMPARLFSAQITAYKK